MLTPLAFGVLCIGAALLAILSVIDIRLHILPNKLVLAFAVAGLTFHYLTDLHYVTINEALIGALVGGGLLWVVRIAAFVYYVEDALGLGDVKLLAAGGIWLGMPDIFLAISIGALIGVVHGCLLAVGYYARNRRWPQLKYLNIPAGPGFSLGIVIAGAMTLGMVNL